MKKKYSIEEKEFIKQRYLLKGRCDLDVTEEELKYILKSNTNIKPKSKLTKN